MNILIVDDESLARKRLIRLLKDMEGFDVIAEAQNGQQAIELCETYQPDIVLMDIRMPGIDGIEAAQKITQSKEPPAIIYCTAFSDHALQAFKTHAVDYLLKPVNKESLFDALNSATQISRAQKKQINQFDKASDNDVSVRKHICARVRGNLVLVAIEDIYFFQADQKYITVRHKQGSILIEETLLSLEKEFNDRFLRIHRNALVALDKIVGLKKDDSSVYVTMNDIEESLEVSRRHLPAVRKVIKSL